MRQILATLIAGLLAAGAYAQNPPGTSSQEQVITNSKPQDRAQNKVDARPQGKDKKVGRRRGQFGARRQHRLGQGGGDRSGARQRA